MINLLPFAGETRFAQYAPTPDKPYLESPPLRLDIDGKVWRSSWTVLVRGEPRGTILYEVREVDCLRTWDDLFRKFEPVNRAMGELILSWDAYTTSNLWC